MPSLLDKLRAYNAAEPRKAAPVSKTDPEGFLHRSADFPLSLFGSRSAAAYERLSAVFGIPFPRDYRHEDVLFLDTETTGLSGGAGTVAFQIGIGYFEKNRFVTEQYLMKSYAQESLMLEDLSRKLRRFRVLCTFNGKSFDVPLLQSRFTMQRIDPGCLPALHADVLYPARRLWKLRLKRCTLSALEEDLLNVHRVDDLPGAEVPQTYFRFLEDGNFEPLERILEHNRQDIVSLAQLYFLICRHTTNPEGVTDQQDLFSLAKEYQREGDRPSSKKCYRMLSSTALRPEAYQALAGMEKQDGRYRQAIALYQTMVSRGEQTVSACEALAKLYEHNEHNLSYALHYTELAMLCLSEPSLRENQDTREARLRLQKRYARLCKKQHALDHPMPGNDRK